MKALLNTHVTYIWLVLAGLSALSWILFDNSADPYNSPQWIGISLMVLAFFKVRLVIMHFMEIATAPFPLRAVFEVWCVAICALIVVMYLVDIGPVSWM